MGKSQKKRSMRRHNPMRVPDSHLPKGLAAASSSSNKTEAVLPIIKKVQPVLFFFLSFFLEGLSANLDDGGMVFPGIPFFFF